MISITDQNKLPPTVGCITTISGVSIPSIIWNLSSSGLNRLRPPVQLFEWRKRWPLCLEMLLERFRSKQGNTHGIKDFISVLMLYKHFAASEIEAAVNLALAADVGSSAAVAYILCSATRSCDQPVRRRT